MSEINFEEIKEEHLQQVMEIYNYYIVHTTISFHTEALTMEQIIFI
jgi:phosphinothricin acetyltransferase